MIAAASSVVMICRLLLTLGSVTNFFALFNAAPAAATASLIAVSVAVSVAVAADVVDAGAAGPTAAADAGGSGAFFHASSDKYSLR